MNSYNLYVYREMPYFSIDVDADTVGFSMVELLISEYSKLAKEKLNEGDYEDALEFCKTANKLNGIYEEAKKELAEREEKKDEDSDGDTERSEA